MREYLLELEIHEGKGGWTHAGGTHPDLVRDGIAPGCTVSTRGDTRSAISRISISSARVLSTASPDSSAALRAAERSRGASAARRARRRSTRKARRPKYVRWPDQTACEMDVKITRRATSELRDCARAGSGRAGALQPLGRKTSYRFSNCGPGSALRRDEFVVSGWLGLVESKPAGDETDR